MNTKKLMSLKEILNHSNDQQKTWLTITMLIRWAENWYWPKTITDDVSFLEFTMKKYACKNYRIVTVTQLNLWAKWSLTFVVYNHSLHWKADEFLMNRYSMGKISGKISIVTNDVSNSFVSQIQITTPKNDQHIFQHFNFPLLISWLFQYEKIITRFPRLFIFKKK